MERHRIEDRLVSGRQGRLIRGHPVLAVSSESEGGEIGCRRVFYEKGNEEEPPTAKSRAASLARSKE